MMEACMVQSVSPIKGVEVKLKDINYTKTLNNTELVNYLQVSYNIAVSMYHNKFWKT